MFAWTQSSHCLALIKIKILSKCRDWDKHWDFPDIHVSAKSGMIKKQ